MSATNFNDFMKAREKAAEAYVRDDGAKVDTIDPHSGAASFHSPAGDTITGGGSETLIVEGRTVVTAETVERPLSERPSAESGSRLIMPYARAHAREKSLKNFPWKYPNADYPKGVNGTCRLECPDADNPKSRPVISFSRG
jgi:hypothetical protein